jgi:hypothetical protein
MMHRLRSKADQIKALREVTDGLREGLSGVVDGHAALQVKVAAGEGVPDLVAQHHQENRKYRLALKKEIDAIRTILGSISTRMVAQEDLSEVLNTVLQEQGESADDLFGRSMMRADQVREDLDDLITRVRGLEGQPAQQSIPTPRNTRPYNPLRSKVRHDEIHADLTSHSNQIPTLFLVLGEAVGRDLLMEGPFVHASFIPEKGHVHLVSSPKRVRGIGCVLAKTRKDGRVTLRSCRWAPWFPDIYKYPGGDVRWAHPDGMSMVLEL